MAKAVSKTRAQWAAEIRAAHTKSVAAILKLGLTLTAAKQALPHGEWLAMVKTDLLFTATVAQRLMKIAADPKLANAARAQLLPPAWSALYELTKLPEETFAKAASTGAIHPKMTRDDVRTMVGKLPTFNVTHETRPMVAAPLEPPLQITSDKTKPQAEMVNLSVYTAGNKLQQIKKLVAELAADVRRGDAALPASFETQIRIVLLTQRRSASKTEPNAEAAAIIAVARKCVVPGCFVIVIAAVAVTVVSVDITKTAGAPAASKLITDHTNLFDVGGFRCSYCCGIQRRRRSSGGQERGGSHNGKDCPHAKPPSGCLVHQLPSSARSIAGDFGFLTLIQNAHRPAL